MPDKTPAFPSTEPLQEHTPFFAHHEGMTLRDYFAAKAMQAIISRADSRFTTTLEFVGGKAYQFADAMIAARES